MSVDKVAADRLAHALVNAGVPFDANTAAGLVAIGTAILRVNRLSLADVQELVAMVWDATPDLARDALAKADKP